MPPALDQLASLLEQDVCLVGIGNRLKGDDAVGPMLIDAVRDQVSFACIDAGVAVENHLEQIVSRGGGDVLFFDAMDFGGEPGEIRMFQPGETAGDLSTHALSLQLAADYVRARCGTDIWLVGIQPGDIGLEHDLSESVQQALDRLRATIVSALPDR